MGDKAKRDIVRITLDESRVAAHLFRLQRKSLAGQPLGNLQLAKLEKSRLWWLPVVSAMREYTERAKEGTFSEEQVATIEEAEKSLKKKNVQLLEFHSAVKAAADNMGTFLHLEFFEFLLESAERRAKMVELIRNAAQWMAFIPGLSFEKIFGPHLKELSDEIDTFENRNYDVTFNSVVLFCASIALVVTVAAPNGNIPKFLSEIPYSPFYFGVTAFFAYVAVEFGRLFIQNAYQKRKRALFHDFLLSLTDPFQTPELIDDEYLVHVLESFRLLSEHKENNRSRKDYEKLREPVRTAIIARQGGLWESAVATAKLA